MGQGFEFKTTNQRLRSLLTSPISSKGLLVQALAYPFALPAIASPLPRTVPNAPSPVAVLNPAPQDINAAAAIADDVESAPPATIPIEPLPTETLPTAFIPPEQLNPKPPTYESSEPPEEPETPLNSSTTHAPSEYAVRAESEVSIAPEPTPEEPEFSWFEMDGLTEAGNPQKTVFVTRLEKTTEEDLLNHPILIAGPQDLNPGLSDPKPAEPPLPNNPQLNNPTAEPPFSPDNAIPPPAKPIPVENTPAEPSSADLADEEQKPFVQWNDLEVSINSDFNNFGESNWSVLPVLSGELANGSQIAIATGFSQFQQDDFESVGHIPLTLSWQGDVNDIELEVSGGIDFFNRLPVDTHASAIATAPIGEDAFVSVAIEQGPYLFNAQTLENEISRWQYGPEIYWQILPKLSFFSKLSLGNYSDGNWEQQSFSRLERTIGEEASVSLNFLNQSFQENREATSGYFSPPDFLVATAEMSWKEKITEGLSCGLLGSVGQQRLEGEWALAYSGQAICTVDIASALQVDLGYQFSNVSNDQSALVDDSAFSSQQIIGGIRVTF